MTTPLSAALEDYLGVILRLQQERRVARVRDIADQSNVAKSAVTAALKTLSAKGLVNYEPYEPVTLTSEGAEQAEYILLRRRLLEDFLTSVLALEPVRAAAAAGDMEHAVDREAMERFVCFLAFVNQQHEGRTSWLAEFRSFVAGGTDNAACRACIQAHLERLRSSGGSRAN